MASEQELDELLPVQGAVPGDDPLVEARITRCGPITPHLLPPLHSPSSSLADSLCGQRGGRSCLLAVATEALDPSPPPAGTLLPLR